MIARVGSGWQTVLADLSIILFMIAASAVSQAGEEPDCESIQRGKVGPRLRGDDSRWVR